MSVIGENAAWLDAYDRLMFCIPQSREKMDIACDLKNNNMPKLLFKYRTCSEQHMEAFEKDILYASQPSKFNDNFECRIVISKDNVQKNNYRKAYRALYNRYYNMPNKDVTSFKELCEAICISFGGDLQDIRQQDDMYSQLTELEKLANNFSEEHLNQLQHVARNLYSICSMSSDYCSDTMWAYYADSNRGFCVGYNIKEQAGDLSYYTLPVIYKDDCYLSINDSEQINGSVAMQMLSYKSVKWQHEKEWRIFCLPHTRQLKMPTPSVLYLGSDISDANAKKLKSICATRNIPVYKMKADLLQGILVSERAQ